MVHHPRLHFCHWTRSEIHLDEIKPWKDLRVIWNLAAIKGHSLGYQTTIPLLPPTWRLCFYQHSSYCSIRMASVHSQQCTRRWRWVKNEMTSFEYNRNFFRTHWTSHPRCGTMDQQTLGLLRKGTAASSQRRSSSLQRTIIKRKEQCRSSICHQLNLREGQRTFGWNQNEIEHGYGQWKWHEIEIAIRKGNVDAQHGEQDVEEVSSLFRFFLKFPSLFNF